MKNGQNPYEMECKEYERHESEKNRESLKKNYPRVVVNVAETQYQVVKLVAKKLKWVQLADPVVGMNFDLCWTDNHVKQEIFYKMHQSQKINHFPGMDILSRKNNLGKSLMAFKLRFEEEYNFFPNTWMLPADFANLKDYHDRRQAGRAQTFIVKPEASCQGRGIFLTRNIEKLKGQKCVVQRYIHKPFLIDGLKFDMRIYVLVAGTDPLRIFVYEEGLARFATEVYTAPRTDNLENKYMHLTNYAINKNSPNFVFNESLQDCDKGHKRTLSSAYKTIGEMGYNVEQLKEKIDDIIIKTIITGHPTLSRIQQTIHPQNYANDMCFQILGLDVMMDSNLNPVILEVNYTPSFTTDTPLDKHIKKNLITDAVKLLGITDEWKFQMKKQRESEVKERMMSGKRKKLNVQEKIEVVQHYARERDLYEAEHLGNFRKIFVKSDDQFQDYRKYYEFAQELYIDQNRLTGIPINCNSHYLIPFIRDPKQPLKRKKDKRENSLFSSALRQDKKVAVARSIETRKITSAKSTTKRVVVSSVRNLNEQKMERPENVYFEESDVVFNNGNLKDAFTKKKVKNNTATSKE